MKVFLDFDGTVTRADVVDAMLERYADPGWRRVEEAWRAGRIGSRACLGAQIDLVRATTREIDDLLDAIDVDEGFVELLETCSHSGVPVHILSDGFDYCIDRILRRPALGIERLLRDLQVRASHLEPAGDRGWRAAFPFAPDTCTHGCATCKPTAMRLLSAAGPGPILFAGDGLSDRFAASAADVVFAKDELARHCVQEHITHAHYIDLRQVARAIDSMLLDTTTVLRAGGMLRGRP